MMLCGHNECMIEALANTQHTNQTTNIEKEHGMKLHKSSLVKYYTYGVSVPSLLIESTDSMIDGLSMYYTNSLIPRLHPLSTAVYFKLGTELVHAPTLLAAPPLERRIPDSGSERIRPA